MTDGRQELFAWDITAPPWCSPIGLGGVTDDKMLAAEHVTDALIEAPRDSVGIVRRVVLSHSCSYFELGVSWAWQTGHGVAWSEPCRGTAPHRKVVNGGQEEA